MRRKHSTVAMTLCACLGAHASASLFIPWLCDLNGDGVADLADLGILLSTPPATHSYFVVGSGDGTAWNWSIEGECPDGSFVPLAGGTLATSGDPITPTTATQVAADFAAFINAASPNPAVLSASSTGPVIDLDVRTGAVGGAVRLCVETPGLHPDCCAVFGAICPFNPLIVALGSGPGCNPNCAADLNLDGVVDGTDLGLLLSKWGENFTCYDLNGDGTIDGADLGLLLGSWAACPP